MKILHLSTHDLSSGAGRGAYWLHNGLRQIGVDSSMLVNYRISDDYTVHGPGPTIREAAYRTLNSQLEMLPLKLYKRPSQSMYSTGWTLSNIHRKVQSINPDLVNLHWICSGFTKPENLAKFDKPIVWTLRDMWAFTGGCHYASDCERYMDRCGSCPQLGSTKTYDLSRNLWQRKKKAWHNLNITIVAISHWLADCARKSSLFHNYRIEVIHNAIDIKKFKPVPKKIAREILQLPQDRKILLFGALQATQDDRKGFTYLIEAIRYLLCNELNQPIEAVVFGASKPQNPLDINLPVTYLGRLSDESTLALAYSAADVMVVPSVQEAFGKTAIEAMACGTPVVSFDTSGLRDIVEHHRCGYRAECFSTKDLAFGITWVLQDQERWQMLSKRAREKVEQEFTVERQAELYCSLYKNILEQNK